MVQRKRSRPGSKPDEENIKKRVKKISFASSGKGGFGRGGGISSGGGKGGLSSGGGGGLMDFNFRTFLWEEILELATQDTPDKLNDVTFWAKIDQNTLTLSGSTNFIEKVPNSASTHSDYHLSQSQADHMPELITVNGKDAADFTIKDQNVRFFDIARKNDGSQLQLNELFDLRSYHFFLVFHHTSSFTSGSAVTSNSHLVVDQSTVDWAIYGQSGSQGQKILPYMEDASHNAYNTTHDNVTMNETHLIEVWFTKSVFYSKIDDGQIQSQSTGTELDVDQFNPDTLGMGIRSAGSLSSVQFSGSMMEIIFCSSSNRDGTTPIGALNNVRNYFSSEYGMKV